MSTAELVRSWRDEDYRLTLDTPMPHPAGDPAREVFVSLDSPFTTCASPLSCVHLCSY